MLVGYMIKFGANTNPQESFPAFGKWEYTDLVQCDKTLFPMSDG